MYLGGTGSTPAKYNTAHAWLLKSTSFSYFPIALSYIWANYADAEKNEHIRKSSSDADVQQANLEKYHRTVLFGGESDLVSVSPEQSVIGRLKTLILDFIDKNYYPNLFRNAITKKDSGEIDLKYEKFVFSGHSQGASHVAYLSKYVKLNKAILFSGPQELLSSSSTTGTVSWLQGEFKTSSIYAFMHAEEEFTADLIRSNWLLMKPFQFSNDESSSSSSASLSTVTTAKSAPPSPEPTPPYIGVEIFSSFLFRNNPLSDQIIQKCERNKYYEECKKSATYRRCFYSKIPPAKPPTGTKPIARPNHNSTVTDNLTPRTGGTNEPIYADDIWEILLTNDF